MRCLKEQLRALSARQNTHHKDIIPSSQLQLISMIDHKRIITQTSFHYNETQFSNI